MNQERAAATLVRMYRKLHAEFDRVRQSKPSQHRLDEMIRLAHRLNRVSQKGKEVAGSERRWWSLLGTK